MSKKLEDLLSKLKKSSSIKDTSLIEKSKIYGQKEYVQTPIPMLNVALSGDLNGGLTSGVTVLAGPSKHFKSAFSLIIAASYQKKYPDSVVLLFDSEFGMPESYFEAFGVDLERVIHIPITDIEALKTETMKQLNDIEKGDRVIMILDSLGGLASKKEVDDALAGNTVTDMTRAKAIKSYFRMVTPHLTIKDIPLLIINHSYSTIEKYAKQVVGGGTGVMYSADTVWIIGRQQEKDGTELKGYNFVINIEKSRFVKEKSKIPITVLHEGGINKWSGLMNLALESGHVIKPSQGWYQLTENGVPVGEKLRAKDIEANDEIWEKILKVPEFVDYINNKYAIGGNITAVEEDSEEES